MWQIARSSSGFANACRTKSAEAPVACAHPLVLVVDDDASVRDSLALLIESAGWRTETFASGHTFLARPRPLTPSCVLLDVLLPDLNGLDVQECMAGDPVEIPIIFMTACADVSLTVRAMKRGAVDFLVKPFRHDALLDAVANGLERSRALLAREAELEVLRQHYASLTSREREVMALVVAGRLNKQVGAELHISEITVKAHRGSMMRKMRAGSLADLVHIAAKLDISPGT